LYFACAKQLLGCRRLPPLVLVIDGYQSCPVASLMAWSRIARPSESSSSAAVNGGGDPEKPPPHAGQLQDVDVQA